MYCVYSPTPSTESTQIVLLKKHIFVFTLRGCGSNQKCTTVSGIAAPNHLDKMESSGALGHVNAISRFLIN